MAVFLFSFSLGQVILLGCYSFPKAIFRQTTDFDYFGYKPLIYFEWFVIGWWFLMLVTAILTAYPTHLAFSNN